MRVLAMLVAHLAAWLFGVLLGLAFGKRGRLPLGRAFGFFEAFLEIVNGLLELRDLLAKLLIFEEQLLVRRRVHADLDNDKPCQLSGIIVVFAVIGKWSLNKHVPLLPVRRGWHSVEFRRFPMTLVFSGHFHSVANTRNQTSIVADRTTIAIDSSIISLFRTVNDNCSTPRSPCRRLCRAEACSFRDSMPASWGRGAIPGRSRTTPTRRTAHGWVAPGSANRSGPPRRSPDAAGTHGWAA